MGKWKKDAKEFAVGVNYVEDRGYSIQFLNPSWMKLGNPDSLKFIIRDDKTIQLVPGKSVSYSGKVKHNG